MDVDFSSAELVPPLMPNLCVRTGNPASTTAVAKFRYTPLWVWCLIPCGFLVAIIVAECVSTKIETIFPVSPEVIAAKRRKAAVGWGLLGGGVLLFFAAAATAGSSLGALCVLLGIGCVLAGLVVAERSRVWLTGRLRKDGQLTLKKVAPEWARQRQALVNQYWAGQQEYARQQWAAQQYAIQQHHAAHQQWVAQQHHAAHQQWVAQQQYPAQQQSAAQQHWAGPPTLPPANGTLPSH